jgi:hypothetical protein
MSQKAVKWRFHVIITVGSSTRLVMNRDTPQKRWVGESQALAEIKVVTKDCLPAHVIRTSASMGA